MSSLNPSFLVFFFSFLRVYSVDNVVDFIGSFGDDEIWVEVSLNISVSFVESESESYLTLFLISNGIIVGDFPGSLQNGFLCILNIHSRIIESQKNCNLKRLVELVKESYD